MSPRPNEREEGGAAGGDSTNNGGDVADGNSEVGGGGSAPPATAAAAIEAAAAAADLTAAALQDAVAAAAPSPGPDATPCAAARQQRRQHTNSGRESGSSHHPGHVRTSPTGQPSPEGSERRQGRWGARGHTSTDVAHPSFPQPEGYRLLWHDDDVEAAAESDEDDEGDDGADEEEAEEEEEGGREDYVTGTGTEDVMVGSRSTTASPSGGSTNRRGIAATITAITTIAPSQSATFLTASRRADGLGRATAYHNGNGIDGGDIAVRLRAAVSANRRLRATAEEATGGGGDGSIRPNEVAEGENDSNNAAGNDGANIGNDDNDDEGRPADAFGTWAGRVRRRRVRSRNGPSSNGTPEAAATVAAASAAANGLPDQSSSLPSSGAAAARSSSTSPAADGAGGNSNNSGSNKRRRHHHHWQRQRSSSRPEETTLRLLRGSYHVCNEARRRMRRRQRRRQQHESGDGDGGAAGSSTGGSSDGAHDDGDDDGGTTTTSCVGLLDLQDPRFDHRPDAREGFVRPPESLPGEVALTRPSSAEDGTTTSDDEGQKDGNEKESRVELLVRGCRRAGGILDVGYVRSLVEPVPLDRAAQTYTRNGEDEALRLLLRRSSSTLARGENDDRRRDDDDSDSDFSGAQQDEELIGDLITTYVARLRSLRVPSCAPFVREQIRRAHVVQGMLIQSEERRLANNEEFAKGSAVVEDEMGLHRGASAMLFKNADLNLAGNEEVSNETKFTLALGSVCMASLNSLLRVVKMSSSLVTDSDIVAQPLNALDTMVRSFFTPLCFYEDCSSYRCGDESSPDKANCDVWKVLKDLLSWLRSVCTTPSVSRHRDLALGIMLRMCSATGMLSHILLTIEAMMRSSSMTSADSISTEVGEVASHVVCRAIEDRMLTVKSSGAYSKQKSKSLQDVRFDPTEMSHAGLSLSCDGTVVRSTTSQHTHCYLNRGFTSGKWAWEFLLTQEIPSDESTCLGAGLKPVTSSSYNASPNLWMYRCYNGNLYHRGSLLRNSSSAGASSRRSGKQRIHPNDVVRIQLDCEEQTLSYTINGTNEQGACFCGVTGGPVHPAVSFYGANRSVKLLCVESTEEYGKGVRFYRDDDSLQRKMWHGEMKFGERNGTGMLFYHANKRPSDDFPESRGYWCGHWRNDKQHGLSAWVLTDENGVVDIDALRLYWFEDGLMIRSAGDGDKEATLAQLECRGWACDRCRFVNTSDSSCLVCSSSRTMPLPRVVNGGPQSCKTLGTCSASILKHLGELAVAHGEDDGNGAPSRPESDAHRTNKGHAMRSPYVIEPCMDVFQGLDQILNKFVGDHEQDQGLSSIAKVSALRLLKVNFDRLSPNCVMGAQQMAAIKDGMVLCNIRTSLETLVKEEGLIGQCAANALASGFEILFSDYESRCKIFQQLLSQHNGVSSLPAGSGQYTLLKSLLARFGSDESVGLLFPTGMDSRVEATLVEQLLQSLFDCVENSGMRFIQLYGEGTLASLASPICDVADVSASAMQLLLATFRALLSEAIVVEAERKRTVRRKGSDLGIQLFLIFSRHTLRVSLFLLQRAKKACNKYDDLELMLSHTAIFSVLPLFTVASLHCSDLLWFAEATMPLVSEVVHELDTINEKSSKVNNAEQYLMLLEQRSIDAATFKNMCGNVSQDVPAVFDDEHGRSDDMSVSEEGRLLRSMSSSNQHCLVNVGIRRGRAAWELQLVSDSQADECSAFGVATRPITSSVYETSPNMWVIRSYNGQCYNGTCSNYPKKSKIHPNDE